VPRRPHTNDLFELFPDLPWHGHARRRAGLADALRRQVDAWRARAQLNIDRQRAAAAAVRAALGTRRSPPVGAGLAASVRRRR
jgi:hypothetical protein